MDLIFQDSKKRIIDKKEAVPFTLDDSGFYLVGVAARAKDEKQVGGTDDDDLRIELDKTTFPQLTNLNRYLDSPAAFSGGKLRDRKQHVLTLTNLQKGTHNLTLIPDGSPTLEEINIWKLPSQSTLELKMNNTAEDGNRRPWVVFILLNASLGEFSVDLTLKRRFIDSDDVKIAVDGVIIRNNRSVLHKFWYFIASLFGQEIKSNTFKTKLAIGLHYIELWADRMPTLNSITFRDLIFPQSEEKDPVEIIKDKIIAMAREYGFDPEMMLRVAKKESQFNPRAVSPAGAKGLFQLMPITIDQINNLGYEVSDVFNVDQNIKGAMIYFQWLSGMYPKDEEYWEKIMAAWNWGQGNFPKEGPLGAWKPVPNETINFINYVLNR
ncbi:MAG: lytic transglycosylase domain-containing protein [Patescibacteria group bacterium]